MKKLRFMAGLFAIGSVACSSPTKPTETSAAAGGRSILEVPASATAITTTRLRLRRVDFGDIQTGLANGQVLNVTVNWKLDIWAEIARLETDRARLLVDWGNGNVDFSGCGACRVENTYSSTGRYTATAKVLDLNAPSGSEPITQVTFTINVLDPPRTCATSLVDFESATGAGPYAINGVSVASTGGLLITIVSPAGNPEVVNRLAVTGALAPISITFPDEKTDFSAGVLSSGGVFPVSYQAFDVGGALVASDTVSLGPVVGFGNGKGFVRFNALPFNRVVLTVATGNYLAVDNVIGSCQ